MIFIHSKILLINPYSVTKYPQPPIGLAIIAGILEKNGYSVEILDLPALGISECSLPEIIRRDMPDIVGITAMTPAINSAIQVANTVKEVNSDILVILGGPHATLLPEETLQSAPNVDFIVRGEAEQTILELINTLKENPSKIGDVLGVTYRDSTLVKSNSPRPLLIDMDNLPFPAFHLLPIKKYRLHPPFGRRTPVMPIITSRGCPYRCIFCSKGVFGKKYRCNSPTYIVNEINFLKEMFGVREIKFYDDVFTLNRKRIIALCTQLKQKGLDIPWSCETRVNLVDIELLKIMKDAGCYMIEYGVESGNKEILNILKKDTTLERIKEAFKLTHEAGIETVAYFVMGSPGETAETIRDTIEFAKEIGPDFVQFSLVTPFPGTELFDLVTKASATKNDWTKYTYASLKSDYQPIFETTTLDGDILKKWNSKAYKEFYLRRNYVWKRIKGIRSLDDLRVNINGLRMFSDMVNLHELVS